MTRDDIINDYFEWLYDIVSHRRFSERISFRALLSFLHDTEFTYILPRDVNRIEDGLGLRCRFAVEYGFRDVPDCLSGPCSVLEMMIALAKRCEEDIMDDPVIGNRTSQWFWGMITNLGLGGMTNDRFDERLARDIMVRFLNRKYEPDGKGGLFRIRNCDQDLRTVEIWYQMCWYLDSISV